MADAYLKWYYGYQNFWDELLFFGIIKWILDNYALDMLYVEVGDKVRMEKWMEKNFESFGFAEDKWRSLLDKIRFVENKWHKIGTHIRSFFGLSPYKKMFKFFGGGEVLTDERKCPHDGRNIPLLFGRTVRRHQFVLLWGIASPHTCRTRILYNILLRRAKNIIVRDKTSFENAHHYVPRKAKDNLILHEDFALEIIQRQESSADSKRPLGDAKYILINTNHKECTPENREKIQAFCKEYPLHQKIFFPCDMYDDAKEFKILKQDIPDLIYYNRTEHNIPRILDLFAYCDGGIWCRLHFLLPLKIYKKSFEAIPYAEKIEKMILK